MRSPCLNRIWHPWHVWEDYKHNFYGGVSDNYIKDKSLQIYAELLKDLSAFDEALKIILSTWTHSCEHNLSNDALNRIAYLGQAACALVYKVPHTVSMGAYNLLSETEKKQADALAQKYLNIWIKNNDVDTKKI